MKTIKSDLLRSEFGDLTKENYHFFTHARWNSHDLLLYILEQIGPSHVSITSFSLSDITIRSFKNAIDAGLITGLNLVLNSAIRFHKLDLLCFVGNITSEIILANVHMKLMVIEGKDRTIVVNQSANASVNNAYEAGVLCTDPAIAEIYKSEIQRFFSEYPKINLNEHFKRTASSH